MLRQLFYTLVISLFVVSAVQSQNLALQETNVKMGKELYPSWVVDLEEVDAGFAKKSFADYAKKNLDVKMKKHEKSGLIGKEVRLNQVYPERRADLVVDIQEVGQSSKMSLAFVMGYDIILNSKDNPDEMKKFQNLASDIILNIYDEYYEKQIKQLNSELKDLNKQISKNQKSTKKLSGQINKNEKKITDSDEVTKAKLQADNIGNQASIDANEQMNLKLKEGINKLELRIEEIQSKKRKLRAKN